MFPEFMANLVKDLVNDFLVVYICFLAGWVIVQILNIFSNWASK